VNAGDAVTSALTGHLAFYLLLAAVLTWPIALAILRLYTRAVQRSMRSQARGAPTAVAAGSLLGEVNAYTPPRERPPAPRESVDALFTTLCRRPWRAAAVYGVAGVIYALIMAAAQLLADGFEILPVRFLFLFWIFAWPVALTTVIVAVSTRRARMVVIGIYLAGLLAIGGIARSFSPDLTWLQVVGAWILFDLPATVLLVTYLARRIRAVGPLILTFILLALLGSDVAVSVAGSDDSYLRTIVAAASSVGLGGSGAFGALLIAGFVVFAFLGWGALIWIGRRYRAKTISDESVTIHAIWLLFAIVHSMSLVFGAPAWTLAAVVAFAAYVVCAKAGFRVLARTDAVNNTAPALLVLRSFSIGRDSERMFDVVGRHWRRAGTMQLIAGIDLVSRTVEPHEFLEFVSGRLSRRFIDSEEALNRRMAERDSAPDRDLRFRVNEFFCYDDTWKMVLSRLVQESRVVLMDLRGFTRENAGCVFELRELARLVPFTRVVLIADRRTDEALLAETLGSVRAEVLRLGSMGGGQVRQLLRALANAAAVLMVSMIGGTA
jgi:hypothetical protein